MPKNWCFWTVVLEKTLESPLDCKDIQAVSSKGNQVLNIHWKCWSWSSNTLATWWKELTHWKRPWCWERLKARREVDDRGWSPLHIFRTFWSSQIETLKLFKNNSYSSPPTLPFSLVTSNLLPVFYEFTCLDISYMWNHTTFVFLYMAYFNYGNVFKVYLSYNVHENLFPF